MTCDPTGGTCSPMTVGMAVLVVALVLACCSVGAACILINRRKAPGGVHDPLVSIQQLEQPVAVGGGVHDPLLSTQQLQQTSVQPLAVAQTVVVPTLQHFVMMNRFQDLAAAFDSLGIVEVSEFGQVTDEQLFTTGMNVIQVNRLRKQAPIVEPEPEPEPAPASAPTISQTIDASIEAGTARLSGLE